MDTNLPVPIESDGDGIELTTIPDEFGAVVIGTDDELTKFAQRWQEADGPGTVAILSENDIQRLIQVAPQLIGAAKTARYVFGPALWRQANGPAPGTLVTYHRMTRSASTGKILANPRVVMPPGAAAGAAGGPPVMLALAGIEIALNQLADRIEARLDVIEDKVDEVLRLASAQRLGDVYGHLRLLKRRLSEVSGGNHLTNTDWSSIASLGTDLEVGVERLRRHALHLLASLRPDDPADKRADTLKGVVEKGRLSETLQLLLVAQQSLYMWQRLRLERVSSAEPDFLPQTIESARTTLREQLDADRELAVQLRSTMHKYAALRVTEVHHRLAARTLTKYREPLAEMVDRFIDIRGLQVDGWLGVPHATFRDALTAATSKADEITRRGRKRLARLIDPDEE
ncbi:hypothetical protein A5763_21745 [Mycolicibacterium fortuitum]|uniref:hypothetical protein n=1 Tax=Mycolicibacterium fortuitum TaxID=1766 RepID=UPI0007EA4ACC|nr:hypothetical protein [Mycolicibacterium fortuitum]OBB22793.1 hypothetical protein A5763_21745 [Mycolicibacterium fortuitum]